MTTENDPRTTLIDLLPKFRFAMVTTVDDDGALTARPLTVQDHEFDGDLWFIVPRDSAVVAHIATRPGVGVSLSANDAWVSIAGRAEVVEDPARLREYWSSSVDAWFPEGPEDPNITLLKVDAASAEYWSSPGGVVATVVSLVKSKITGEPYEGKNDTVQL